MIGMEANKIAITDEALRRAAAKKLRTDVQTLKKLALVKRSVDARKKQDVRFVVTVDVETDGNEDKLLSRVRDSHVTKAPKRTYAIPPHGTLSQRPVVVGLARRACSQAYCSHAPACARSS